MTQGTQNLYNMVTLFCPEELAHEFLQRYGNPQDKFFGKIKAQLADHLALFLKPIQERYAMISDEDVRDILTQGAKQVRAIAGAVLLDMQRAMGLKR